MLYNDTLRCCAGAWNKKCNWLKKKKKYREMGIHTRSLRVKGQQVPLTGVMLEALACNGTGRHLTM